MVKKNMYST